MRTFKIYRIEDISGVSGTGVIAEGVVFHDDQIAVSWFGAHHLHPDTATNLEAWLAVHGHGGRTYAVFDEVL